MRNHNREVGLSARHVPIPGDLRRVSAAYRSLPYGVRLIGGSGGEVVGPVSSGSLGPSCGGVDVDAQ